MDRFGVPRAVLVQHLGECDNMYIEQVVAARPERFAGVFLVDTEEPDARDALAHWASTGVFRGIRLLARSLETNPALWDDVVRLGLNIIACDTSTLAPYADSLRSFLNDHPDARMVIAHFGLWTLWQPADSPIHDQIQSLADCPGAFMQVSGMHMHGEYPYNEIDLVREGRLGVPADAVEQVTNRTAFDLWFG